MLQSTFCLGSKAELPRDGIAAEQAQLRLRLTPRQAIELSSILLNRALERAAATDLDTPMTVPVGIGEMAVSK